MSANLRRHVVALCAAMALPLAGVVALSGEASAGVVRACGTEVNARTVVVGVHGFKGKPDSWSEGNANSMFGAIGSIPGVSVVEPFDYEDYNLRWVTDPHIGKALANQINCLSAASKKAGGNGKIVVVAHSMGGLALREAMRYVSPSKVGLAIMIGTPHNGAPLAKWCAKITPCAKLAPAAAAMSPGSSQLRKLPQMPTTVPLRAIAGKILVKGKGTHDGIVSVSSATAKYTTKYAGDGSFVQSCTQVYPFFKPSCHHENLLKDAGVQGKVIQALGEYVRSLKPPTPKPSPTPTVSITPSVTPTPTPTTPASPSPSCNTPTPSEPEGDTGGAGHVPLPCGA